MTARPDTERSVEEAIPKTVWPETVNAVAEAVERVACPVTPSVPATPSVNAGEEEPIPTFPFCKIEKSDVPVEDATENGFSPLVPWIENLDELTDDEVPTAMNDALMREVDVADTPLP